MLLKSGQADEALDRFKAMDKARRVCAVHPGARDVLQPDRCAQGRRRRPAPAIDPARTVLVALGPAGQAQKQARQGSRASSGADAPRRPRVRSWSPSRLPERRIGQPPGAGGRAPRPPHCPPPSTRDCRSTAPRPVRLGADGPGRRLPRTDVRDLRGLRASHPRPRVPRRVPSPGPARDPHPDAAAAGSEARRLIRRGPRGARSAARSGGGWRRGRAALPRSSSW